MKDIPWAVTGPPPDFLVRVTKSIKFNDKNFVCDFTFICQ